LFQPRNSSTEWRDSAPLRLVQRAKELVDFARQQGYRLDELVEVIEAVG
jgi:hypothetical protein